MTPLDVLQRENELLRGTISTSEGIIAELESALGNAGVPIPAVTLPDSVDIQSATPEDFWSPAMNVPEGHEWREIYGNISGIPDGDGTECFKWDNTLWSKENHFRVRRADSHRVPLGFGVVGLFVVVHVTRSTSVPSSWRQPSCASCALGDLLGFSTVFASPMLP
jgi:hypothetical protein